MVRHLFLLFSIVLSLVVTISTGTAASDPAIKRMSLSPSSVTGGASTSVVIWLSSAAGKEGTKIWLKTERSDLVSLPESVAIAAGKSSVSVKAKTTPVSKPQTFVIYAGTSSSEAKVELTVSPPVVSRVSISPTTVVGGQSATATVTLSGKAPEGGITVETSVDSGVAGVEGKVTVPAGSASATFKIKTSEVKDATKVTVVAANGKKASASFTVTRLKLNAVSVTPTKVTAGKYGRVTIELNATAPDGASITIKTSDNDIVPLKEKATIKPGARAAVISFKTGEVKEPVKVEIVAIYGESVVSTVVVVNPPAK